MFQRWARSVLQKVYPENRANKMLPGTPKFGKNIAVVSNSITFFYSNSFQKRFFSFWNKNWQWQKSIYRSHNHPTGEAGVPGWTDILYPDIIVVGPAGNTAQPASFINNLMILLSKILFILAIIWQSLFGWLRCERRVYHGNCREWHCFDLSDLLSVTNSTEGTWLVQTVPLSAVRSMCIIGLLYYFKSLPLSEIYSFQNLAYKVGHMRTRSVKSFTLTTNRRNQSQLLLLVQWFYCRKLG